LGISVRESPSRRRRPVPDLRVRRKHPGREGGDPGHRELRQRLQELGRLAEAQLRVREHAAASTANLPGMGGQKNSSGHRSIGPSEVDPDKVNESNELYNVGSERKQIEDKVVFCSTEI
jgi:hypothetical protein